MMEMQLMEMGVRVIVQLLKQTGYALKALPQHLTSEHNVLLVFIKIIHPILKIEFHFEEMV